MKGAQIGYGVCDTEDDTISCCSTAIEADKRAEVLNSGDTERCSHYWEEMDGVVRVGFWRES